MTDDDWGWVNWYATRRHLPSDRPTSWGKQWSLCGTADVEPVEKHAARLFKYGSQPKDYDAIPKCKYCERKAGTT